MFFLAVCRPAWAASFLPQGDLIGDVRYHHVIAADNVYEVARTYDIGIVELLAANPGVDPWQPKPGTQLMQEAMANRNGIPHKIGTGNKVLSP